MYGLIRAEHLNSWASRYTSPAEFPRLVRLLLWAVLGKPRSINFPADEAVRLAGYDGQLDVGVGVAGLPDGASVWELGTNSAIKVKADEDYQKRTENPVGVDRAATTFVFATPRTWRGKGEWARTRSAENVWKNVLAFDAEDLVQWMELSPAVGVWFGRLAGLVPAGVRDLQGTLDDYRLATEPEFDPAGTLIGREAQVAAMLKLLTSDTTASELEAESREEAEAFIGSSIATLPSEEQDAQWARAICIDDEDALRQVAATGENLVLILGEGASQLPATARKHTIVRLSLPGTGSSAAITLAPPGMRQIIDWVERQGIERNEAFRRCYDAGGSLERVRRTYMRSGPPPPAWSRPGVAGGVAVAALIGSWDASNQHDQAFVAAASGVDHAQLEAAIGAWTLGSEALVTRAGSDWRIYNRRDAWRRLEPYLRTEQLDAFLRKLAEVLLEADPRFDLPPEDRWLAGMHGKRRASSETLRKGITESLLYLAVRGDDRQPCYSGTRAQDWATRCVREVFAHRTEANFWRRIRLELTELAEVAPEIFLSAVEQDLKAARPQVLDLFEEEGEHGSCLHAELLWSLELLAWAPPFVGRVAAISAGLAALDPGGRWSNRPGSSLAAMLSPMQPQCGATAEQRRRLLGLLAESNPDVTAKLCETLFSRNGGIVQNSRRPAMRNWAPEERLRPVLVTEYWADVQAAAAQLLRLAGDVAGRWSALLRNLKQLTAELQDSVFAGIEARQARLPVDERRRLREALRKLLHHHNQFIGSEKEPDWLYDAATLERLMRLYESLTPEDVIDQHAWLFDLWPERPAGTTTDWAQERATLDRERLDVANKLANVGLDALLNRLDEFANRHALGFSLAASPAGEELASELFIHYGESVNPAVCDLIEGFAHRLYVQNGELFVERWIHGGGGATLSELACATLLLGLPAEPDTWDEAERRGVDCAGAYWRRVHVRHFERPEEGERAARSLLGVDRVLEAIDVLANSSKGEWVATHGNHELIVDALNRGVAALNAAPENGQRLAYDIATLMRRLNRSGKVNDETMMQLEWSYFGVLEYQTQHELVIYRRLLTDPNILVDLLALVYRPEGTDGKSTDEPDEGAKRAASNAWHVLNDWRPFTKITSSDMPQPAALEEYVDALIEIADQRGYHAIALDHFGKALGTCPPGVDGIWPHESVRTVIERMYASEELKEGFIVGRMNMRGMTSRAIGDGGEQERSLAVTYRRWQAALAVHSPTTSALLGRLADSYERDAQRMDVEDRRRH